MADPDSGSWIAYNGEIYNHLAVRKQLDGIAFAARAQVVEYLGDEQLVHLTRKDTPIQAKLPVEEQIASGQELRLMVPRDKLLLFDTETEERVSS